MNPKLAIERLIRGLVSGRFERLNSFEREKFIDEASKMLAKEADVRQLDDKSRHYLLYRIQRSLLPSFVIADHGRTLLLDDDFRQVFRKFSDDNWTSYERKWNLKELLKLVKDVEGDFAECGVYRGGSAYLLCDFARTLGRHVHLFDSFEGLSEPLPHESHHWTRGDLLASEELLRSNLSRFNNYTTYQGWIPDRFDDVETLKFSFVHVDVDLEQPTRDSIEFFYPRMPPGAVLLLDDHGYTTCPGARAAAIGFFTSKREEVLDLATGQGLVIKSAA